MAKTPPNGHRIDHNTTGLPDSLKSGMESLSGLDLSDVRVHRNSHAPAQMGAKSFSNGSDIYLAPEGAKLLGHELTHVVQQKTGRTQGGPTPSSDAMRMTVRAENAAKKGGA